MKKNLLTYISFLACSHVAIGQWTTNTAVNTQIGYSNHSLTPETATTSDGKTFISYYNNAAGNYDMYLQLLDTAGNKLFGPNGMLVTAINSGSSISRYHLAVDNEDNAIIAFQYQPASAWEAVAFKIDTTGSQLWGSTGIDLGAGLVPSIGVLPSNDVVFAWQQNSGGITYMRYSPAGIARWVTPLSVTSPTAHTVSNPQIVPMSNNEFIFLFMAQPGSSFMVVNHYAQRYDTSGSPVWINATELSPATAGIFNPLSWVPDGNDGCYISFAGGLTPSSNDVFAQHLRSNGTVGWGVNGVDVSDSSNHEFENYIAYDNNSKTTWVLERETDAGQGQSGLYIQKFDSGGNKLLGLNGKVIFPVSLPLYYPAGLQLVNGEPVLVFTDNSNQYNSTKLDTLGNPVWTPATRNVCSLSDQKSHPHLNKFMNHQLVFVWSDVRGGNTGVYAQQLPDTTNINPTGTVPDQTSMSDLLISPNPAHHQFTIYTTSSKIQGTVTVLNTLGEQLYSATIFPGQKEIVVDAGRYSPGIYFIRFQVGNNHYFSKLVMN
jgi:hypothetical protein